MKRTLKQFTADWTAPYLRAFILLALIPFFPEYVSFLLVIGAAYFAIKDMRLHGRSIRIGFIGKLLAVYCLYQTLTCIISTHPLQTALVATLWWFMWGGFVILSNLLTDSDRMDAFILCITTVAGIIGLIACAQYVIHLFVDSNVGSIWGWLDQYVFRIVPFQITLLPYGDRAYSTFANPNMLAQYLVMAAPFVISFNFIERRNSLRLYSRICLILTFAGVMFSFSRGGYIAIIVMAAALVLLNIRHQFAAVTLYVVAAFLVIPKDVINRILSVGMGDRRQIWAEAWSHFLERPLFGYGAGTEPSSAIFYGLGIEAPHAHNILLQLLLEGGIFALLILGLIVFKAVKNGIVLLRNGYNSSFWVGFAVIGFVAGVAIHGIVDYPLTTPKLIAFFLMTLAVIDRSVDLFEYRGGSLRKFLIYRIQKHKSSNGCASET